MPKDNISPKEVCSSPGKKKEQQLFCSHQRHLAEKVVEFLLPRSTRNLNLHANGAGGGEQQ